ncbi:hypothetical protein Dsin_004296 [Dipteronia sinensis]|uniref:Uncharacterized protein n=1 Tax=Dipteronia sinensis TaxID=43782 RepID=A0AAE0BAR1_9ROSI|nr:hypothetical protein Dsin_004296 [Dipteronia sinensis]
MKENILSKSTNIRYSTILDGKITPLCTIIHQSSSTICFKLTINYHSCACSQWKQERKLSNITRKGYATKAKKGLIQLEEEDEPMPIIKVDEKKGSIAGAVALVIGTSIGSGILALPQKASPAVNKTHTLFPIYKCFNLYKQMCLHYCTRHCRVYFQVQYP